MKVLFAADDDNLKGKIAKRFGHAKYYLIFDTETNELEKRINSGHDDEHSGLIDLVKEGVKYFVIGNIGPNAFKVLDDRNAKIFLARKLSVDDALNKFLNNHLEQLEKPTLKRSIEGH